MKLALYMVALICAFDTIANAETQMISADADVTYTADVKKHTEFFPREEVADTKGGTAGAKYFIRKSNPISSTSTITGQGGLLNIPGFNWLKSTDFVQQANAANQKGGIRVQFNNPAGMKYPQYLTLIRESSFDASTGLRTGQYHQVWQVHLIDTSDELDKKQGYQSYTVEPNDVSMIVEAYRKDMIKATENIIQKTVQAACQAMCQLDFRDTDLTGFDSKSVIKIQVVPDEANPKTPAALINWPAYSVVSHFVVHAKTEANLRGGK